MGFCHPLLGHTQEQEKLPIIYIAGPYMGRGWPWPLSFLKQVWNIYRAVRAGVHLMQKGWAVIIPHSMTCLMPLLSGYKLKWEDFMRMDLRIVEAADALLYLAPSKGADIELKHAQRCGKVVYRQIEDVPFTREFIGGDRFDDVQAN